MYFWHHWPQWDSVMQNWKDMRVNQPHCFFVYIAIIAPVDFLQYTQQLNNNVVNYLSLHTFLLPFFGGIFLGKYEDSNELYLPSTTDVSKVDQ